LLSLILLVFSVYIRLKLQESPVFKKMKEEGRGSKHPLRDSFFRYPNNKLVLLALLGATAGQGVVWYTGQFQALFFLQNTLKLDALEVYPLIGASLIIGTPFFIFFGWLSDRIGRLKIILAGCLIAAVTYIPLYKGLTHYTNPALETFQANTKVTVAADPADCGIPIFRFGSWTKLSACASAKDYLASRGISYTELPAVAGKPVVLTIGEVSIEGWEGTAKAESEKAAAAALKAKGYTTSANPDDVNIPMVILLLVIM